VRALVDINHGDVNPCTNCILWQFIHRVGWNGKMAAHSEARIEIPEGIPVVVDRRNQSVIYVALGECNPNPHLYGMRPAFSPK